MLLASALEPYRRTGATAEAKRDILRGLVERGDRDALETFAELIATDPPVELDHALVVFGPFFQRGRAKEQSTDIEALFPRLLDAVAHAAVAAIVLDLANFVVRERRVARHPAADRVATLVGLFSSLVVRLEKLARVEPADAAAWDDARRQAEDGFALLISLSDALALIGDRSATAALRSALDLGHRRLRTEAAAALARLGEADGVDELVRMTAEPVVRARAAAYLDELGHGDRTPAEFATAEAKAEGQLAQWLAAPLQFGIAPSRFDLLDRRRQFWPGYDEPVDCFLFRYVYPTPHGEYSGIGIVGPLVYSPRCDLADLPPDDIYALFAGFQAEHDDIRETPFDKLPADEQAFVAKLCQSLEQSPDESYADTQPVKVGQFFGRRHIVATTNRHGDPGTVIIEAGEPHWYRAGNPTRPIGPTEAYQIHKGRALLATFNALKP